MDLLLMSIIGLVLTALFFLYQFVIKGKTPDKTIRILLFELVGNEKIFLGEVKAFEQDDEKLGIYFYLQKQKKAISDLDHRDFFIDRKYGKCLMLLKYANDDFRPMSRMKENCYYKNEGEEIQIIEPLGVTQTAREVARFTRAFNKRMDEKKGENKSWMEKYAPYLTTGVMALILMIAFVHMSNTNASTQEYIADTFVEGAGEYKKAVEDPLWIEGLVDKMEKKEIEDNTPPS